MILFLTNLMLIFLMSETVFADTTPPVVGWHWYNEQPVQKKKDDKKQLNILYKQFQALSSSEQLKILQIATDELKDKAVLTGNVNDIANYKRAQDFWVSKATMFTIGWERMLLEYPELNYSLQYPHENALAPEMQQQDHENQSKAISEITKQNGLMLFYRGDNKADLMFVKICSDFSKDHHIALLLVSENTPENISTMRSRFDSSHIRASALGINYFPALLLINPTNGSHQTISYGFMSENEIAKRFLEIKDNWKPNF
ncbi:MAG: hypothetical protein A3C44_04555 [Gammaproteobacteria bacterium RIFCSPHIGHO2_02_FULL_39_13]|nr:MAG: hypothetical protein A3C44_04555 [Gammaproteobacteria bacterium RIFCSPHIGHO2_02_FULL_39_13]